MKAPFVALLLALVTSATAQEMQQPELIGAITLPTGLKIGGVEFGGISGLDYDPREDVYYAISDDRSENAPARFYKLKLAINGSGVQSLDIPESVKLLDKAGKPFALKDVDPESIRFNAATGTIYWSSEGDKNGRPFIGEAKTDGSFIREFVLPEAYIPRRRQDARYPQQSILRKPYYHARRKDASGGDGKRPDTGWRQGDARPRQPFTHHRP